MEINKNFNHQSADQYWYSLWLNKGYFNSTPDEREPYTIVMPPPNVTGILHMGHCLNNTIQDIFWLFTHPYPSIGSFTRPISRSNFALS